MSTLQHQSDFDPLTVLPENVPVSMPELPLTRVINTLQQFKAINDPVRSRILGIIQNQPATAKQIADRLDATPGAIGHHLHVLEAAGLAQVVARRITRGIVTSYYTRTARIFNFEFPAEVRGDRSASLDFVTELRDEIAETLAAHGEEGVCSTSFPRARLSPERAEEYRQRLIDLVYEFANETADPQGQVYSMFTALFLAPPYLQGEQSSESPDSSA